LGSVIETQEGHPTLVILVHGMSAAEGDSPMPGVPEPAVPSLDYNRFYFSSGFVQKLLGSASLKTLSQKDVSGSKWEAHGQPASNGTIQMLNGCDESVVDDHFIVPSNFVGNGTPKLSIFPSYRDASKKLIPQTKALINQVYEIYTAKFGTRLNPKSGKVLPNIVFVCHSMGGLAVRTLLCSPSDRIDNESLTATERQRAEAIRDRTNYVVTLATPHEGSPLADRASDFKAAIDNDKNWIALKLIPGNVVDSARGFIGGLVGAPSIGHLRSDFWGPLNRGILAPYRMERSDGSLVPMFAMAAHSPAGGFYTDPVRQSALGGISLPSLDSESYRRNVVRAVGLAALDYFLYTIPTPSGPKSFGVPTAAGQDLVARYHQKALREISKPGELPALPGLGIPTFFSRENRPKTKDEPAVSNQDGFADGDGMVGVRSGLAFRFGSSTEGIFEHGRSWSAGSEQVDGNFYRLPSLQDGEPTPWVFRNHDNIHRTASVGEWIRENILLEAGPLPGGGLVSLWPNKKLTFDPALGRRLDQATLAKLVRVSKLTKFKRISTADEDRP
jgi:hypothetical protein